MLGFIQVKLYVQKCKHVRLQCAGFLQYIIDIVEFCHMNELTGYSQAT